MRPPIVTLANVGISTGRQEFSVLLERSYSGKTNLDLKRGMQMNVQYSAVAAGSNPVFNFTLRDNEVVYQPEVVYYRVQGQMKDILAWQDIGSIQKLSNVPGTTFKIIVPSELTAIIDGMNLNRRLIVEVYFTENGQTVKSTQAVEFELNPLPTLANEYEQEDPTELECHLSEITPLAMNSSVHLFANKPVAEVRDPLLIYKDLEDHEFEIVPEGFILSGNLDVLFIWVQTVGTPVRMSCTVKPVGGEPILFQFDL